SIMEKVAAHPAAIGAGVGAAAGLGFDLATRHRNKKKGYTPRSIGESLALVGLGAGMGGGLGAMRHIKQVGKARSAEMQKLKDRIDRPIEDGLSRLSRQSERPTRTLRNPKTLDKMTSERLKSDPKVIDIEKLS